MRQVMVCAENLARPEIVVSRDGVRVNVTFPDVTTALVRSLIVPVIDVVVCAAAIPESSATIRDSFFIR
jgi:hypothetical protein